MKTYPPCPPNEPRFNERDGRTSFATAARLWNILDYLNGYAQQSAYCIAIVGWMKEARKCAASGQLVEAEVAGENAAKWLTLLDELK